MTFYGGSGPSSIFFYVAMGIGVVFVFIFTISGLRYYVRRRRLAATGDYMDYESYPRDTTTQQYAGVYQINGNVNGPLSPDNIVMGGGPGPGSGFPMQQQQQQQYQHRHTLSTDSTDGSLMFVSQNAYPYNVGASGARRAMQQARAQGRRTRREKKLMTQEQMDARYPAMKFCDAILTSQLYKEDKPAQNFQETLIGGAKNPVSPTDALQQGSTVSNGSSSSRSNNNKADRENAGSMLQESPSMATELSSSSSTACSAASSATSSAASSPASTKKGNVVITATGVDDEEDNDIDNPLKTDTNNQQSLPLPLSWRGHHSKHLSLIFASNGSTRSLDAVDKSANKRRSFLESLGIRPSSSSLAASTTTSRGRSHGVVLDEWNLGNGEEDDDKPLGEDKRNRSHGPRIAPQDLSAHRHSRLHARSRSTELGPAFVPMPAPALTTRRVALRPDFVRHSTPNVSGWNPMWDDHPNLGQDEDDGNLSVSTLSCSSDEESDSSHHIGDHNTIAGNSASTKNTTTTIATTKSGNNVTVVDNDLSTCAVCIDDMTPEDSVRVLSCGHIFHDECIGPWLLSRRACCPMCKRDLYAPKPIDPLGPEPLRETGRLGIATETAAERRERRRRRQQQQQQQQQQNQIRHRHSRSIGRETGSTRISHETAQDAGHGGALGRLFGSLWGAPRVGSSSGSDSSQSVHTSSGPQQHSP
ncbi:uncharacterized protein SAPINGB_P002212 [Magnusiomyces paraingens]|uniref:RING-type domain-containing protein n=1 Tax=Magnusiomyces paraingens TaxID=2606893 RepID=A0A5E8BID6_9ASCO|nr:uncharacterized protein SAPINGB_P002212 [Saprochaete ingens]VVT49320.1 unnamed protein product [Saprochaete ingens]